MWRITLATFMLVLLAIPATVWAESETATTPDAVALREMVEQLRQRVEELETSRQTFEEAVRDEVARRTRALQKQIETIRREGAEGNVAGAEADASPAEPEIEPEALREMEMGLEGAPPRVAAVDAEPDSVPPSPYKYIYHLALQRTSNKTVVRIIPRRFGDYRDEAVTVVSSDEVRTDGVWVQLMFRNLDSKPRRFNFTMGVGRRVGPLEKEVEVFGLRRVNTPMLEPGEVWGDKLWVLTRRDARLVDFGEIGEVTSYATPAPPLPEPDDPDFRRRRRD